VQLINVSFLFPFYLSGNGGITGAAFPPNPVTTSAAGAPNPELLPKLLGAVGVVPQLGAGVKLVLGAGVPNPVEGVLGICTPPLFAPAIFSCVRPNAAIPKTAPIAM
jgi:hypothetical protein